MSTSFTPSKDLILQAKVPPVPSLFSTFSAGHFVRPTAFTQPVKPAAQEAVHEAVREAVGSASFFGGFSEVYAAAPIDLDYDEPNAVCDAEIEFVKPGSGVSQMQINFGN